MLFIYSCSKDDISKKDKRNNCKDCVINLVASDGTVNYTFTYYQREDTFSTIDYCKYIEDYKDWYNTNVTHSGLRAVVKCN